MAETNWLEDPDGLSRATEVGREGFVQRLLSTLVIGHSYHRWNVPERRGSGPATAVGGGCLARVSGVVLGAKSSSRLAK